VLFYFPVGVVGTHINWKMPNLPCQDLNRGPPAQESNALPLCYGSITVWGENFKYLNDFKLFHLSNFPLFELKLSEIAKGVQILCDPLSLTL